MVRIIGIGEYAISNDRNDVIKTFALSSCIAMTAYNPNDRILGMVHIALPYSKITQDKIISSPAYYADSAVPLLIHEMCLEYECIKKNLEIRLYGGAESINKNDIFNIGKRNLEMVKSILKEMDLRECYSDTGGYLSRNIEADVATGAVKVICQPLNF